MKILINFSTPKNPNITFLDRSRNTQKSRCSFSFNTPHIATHFPAQKSETLFPEIKRIQEFVKNEVL